MKGMVDKELAIVERSTMSTVEVFASYYSPNMTTEEKQIIDRFYETVSSYTPKPDLIIFLEADTESLLQRILHRNRPEERNVTYQFIEDINKSYENMRYILTDEKCVDTELVSTKGETIDKVFSKVIPIIERYINRSYSSSPFM